MSRSPAGRSGARAFSDKLIPVGKRAAINVPFQAHALTFSCYRRLPFLDDPAAARAFLACLDQARRDVEFELHAYVVMPEHCHLIVRSRKETYAIGDILRAIKSPSAKAIFGSAPRPARSCPNSAQGPAGRVPRLAKGRWLRPQLGHRQDLPSHNYVHPRQPRPT